MLLGSRSRTPIFGLSVESLPLLPALMPTSDHRAPVTDAVCTGVHVMLGPGVIPMAPLSPASAHSHPLWDARRFIIHVVQRLMETCCCFRFMALQSHPIPLVPQQPCLPKSSEAPRAAPCPKDPRQLCVSKPQLAGLWASAS